MQLGQEEAIQVQQVKRVQLVLLVPQGQQEKQVYEEKPVRAVKRVQQEEQLDIQVLQGRLALPELPEPLEKLALPEQRGSKVQLVRPVKEVTRE